MTFEKFGGRSKEWDEESEEERQGKKIANMRGKRRGKQDVGKGRVGGLQSERRRQYWCSRCRNSIRGSSLVSQ